MPFQNQSTASFVLFFMGGLIIYTVAYVGILNLTGFYEPAIIEANNEYRMRLIRSSAVGFATTVLTVYCIIGIIYAKGGPILNVLFALLGGGVTFHILINRLLTKAEHAVPTVSYGMGLGAFENVILIWMAPGLVFFGARFHLKNWIEQNPEKVLE